MGFFSQLLSLFGGGGPPAIEASADRVWLSHQAKLNGVANETLERLADGSAAVLLIAHFEETLDQMRGVAEPFTGRPVAPMLAEQLRPEAIAGLDIGESAVIDLLFAERHPLPSVDEQAVDFIIMLPCRCRVTHHLSLDDPLMKPFAGDWIKEMLDQLGMKEDEAIESQMVTRRVLQAQKKIEAKATGNQPAASAEEWMEKNLP